MIKISNHDSHGCLRLVIALTGASGVVYGIRLLEELSKLDVESHLILSEWAERNIKIETNKSTEYVVSLANKYYNDSNLEASLSSGSFRTDGMVIIPCSMKTLASIANGFDDTLISRAAAVCMKESRKLVVVPRETPLSRIHIINMLRLSESGVVVL